MIKEPPFVYFHYNNWQNSLYDNTNKHVIDKEGTMMAEIKNIIEQEVAAKINIKNIDLLNIPTGGVFDREKTNEAIHLVARKAIVKAICSEQLEKEIVEQLMSTTDFESLKPKPLTKGIEGIPPF
jgi:hypothetical protein